MAKQPTESRIVTCESMTTGHPDKLCDQISDALLDAQLVRDPYVRCGIEAAASANEVWVFGQVSSRNPLKHGEIVQIVRRDIREIGYESAEEGIDPDSCTVRVTIDPQSADIAMGVVRDGGVIGASDQGIVYGYASDETPEGLPLPLVLAQRIARALTKARTSGAIPWLRPDGKAQVSVRYVGGTPQEVTAFVVSAQHRAETPIDEVRSAIEALARKELGEWVTPESTVHINPTGRFVVGGPLAGFAIDAVGHELGFLVLVPLASLSLLLALFGALAAGREDWLDLWRRLPADPAVEEVRRNCPIRFPTIWLSPLGS